jgi:hypothetical protein
MYVREEAPPGESRFKYVITPVDERLREATYHFARSMVIFRCGETQPRQPDHCGKVLGQLLETSEGVLFLAYRKLADPKALFLKPLNKERKVPTDPKAIGTFLDSAPEQLEVSCDRHGCGAVTRPQVENEYRLSLTEEKPRTVEIRLRDPVTT